MSMTTMKPELRKAFILRAGLAIVRHHGFAAITCQYVASCVDVQTSLATVKHYFRNRDELSREIARYAVDQRCTRTIKEAIALGLIDHAYTTTKQQSNNTRRT